MIGRVKVTVILIEGRLLELHWYQGLLNILSKWLEALIILEVIHVTSSRLELFLQRNQPLLEGFDLSLESRRRNFNASSPHPLDGHHLGCTLISQLANNRGAFQDRSIYS